MSVSATFSRTKQVLSASVCAYSDASCTAAAVGCAVDVSCSTSLITGTITNLNADEEYYVKVSAITDDGAESGIAGPFAAVNPSIDTITFVPNGGAGTMQKQTVTRGVATALTELGYFHTGNWEFRGWNDACDGDGTNYADQANITTNGNVTLYAQWHTYCTGNPSSTNELGLSRIDSVEDHQHNWYKVVQIGDQCWLKENMRATTEPDSSTSIVQATASGTSYSEPRAYRYNNSTTYSDKYGLLYNFPAAMNINDQRESFNYPHRGICPEGWHIPEDSEWRSTLTTAAGCSAAYGIGTGLGKLTGGCDWLTSSSTTAPGNYSYSERNSTGFSALPAVYYNGSFYDAGNYATFWSSTPSGSSFAYYWCFYYGSEFVGRTDYYRHFGISVRCVRD